MGALAIVAIDVVAFRLHQFQEPRWLWKRGNSPVGTRESGARGMASSGEVELWGGSSLWPTGGQSTRCLPRAYLIIIQLSLIAVLVARGITGLAGEGQGLARRSKAVLHGGRGANPPSAPSNGPTPAATSAPTTRAAPARAGRGKRTSGAARLGAHPAQPHLLPKGLARRGHGGACLGGQQYGKEEPPHGIGRLLHARLSRSSPQRHC